MLVAFEGMDGCGKSTISELVSLRTGYFHETQKMCRIGQMNEEGFGDLIKEVRTSDNEKLPFIFYTFRCMFDKSKDNNAIVERSMISTYYFEHDKVSQEEFDYAMSLKTIPDITFLLYASREERAKRIYKRNPNDGDLKREESLFDGYPIMLEFIEKYNIPYIGIDTEKYTVEQISSYCTHIIQDLEELNEQERKIYLSGIKNNFGYPKSYQRRLKI